MKSLGTRMPPKDPEADRRDRDTPQAPVSGQRRDRHRGSCYVNRSDSSQYRACACKERPAGRQPGRGQAATLAPRRQRHESPGSREGLADWPGEVLG